MSKKLLRLVNEKHEVVANEFNLNNSDLKATQGGFRVFKMDSDMQILFEKAFKEKDVKALESLSQEMNSYIEVEESYENMPDLKISENGSVKSLSVSVYSAESKENILLHKLFGKTKD